MKNILFAIIAICLLWACYDDESKLPTIDYPTIVADKTGESQYLMTSIGEEFTYEPRLYRLEGRDSVPLTESELDDYNYEWTMSLVANPSDTAREVISNERVLETLINIAPTNDAYSFYTLTLTLTHKVSGFRKNLIWEMKVLGVYGAGLLVAETEDGENSDLSLIMSRTFNTLLGSYEDDTVYHNIYSKHNNALIPGSVTSLSYIADRSSGYAAITAVAPGKSIVRIDPVTMEFMDKNKECFYYTPDVFNPQVEFESYTTSLLINNGQLQYYYPLYGTKYSYYPQTDYNLAPIGAVGLDWAGGIFWDRNGEQFVYNPPKSTSVWPLDIVIAEGFNPLEMQGHEAIHAEAVTTTRTWWLMKKDGQYYAYLLEYNTNWDTDENYAKGLEMYSLESCPDIADASCFTFSKNKELFYGVGNILYAVPLSGSKPSATPVYTEMQGNITHLLTYRGTGYTSWNGTMNTETGEVDYTWQNAKDRVICAATWDGKEGRVYTLPIQYTGVGGIADKAFVNCYDNFKRITKIAPRK